MPVQLPRMNYDDKRCQYGFLETLNVKRLKKATALEAQIAENSCRALVAKFTAIHEVVTFSGKK